VLDLISYNDVKRGKTFNAMSQGQMMFLWNVLAHQRLVLSCGASYKLVFRIWRHYEKGLLSTFKPRKPGYESLNIDIDSHNIR
jgi:hypothetical protein